MGTNMLRAPHRDPAWVGRLTWGLLGVLLLWPLGVATEFKPWVLLERDNLRISGQFIASFWPLAHGGEFWPWWPKKPGARWPWPRRASRWRW